MQDLKEIRKIEAGSERSFGFVFFVPVTSSCAPAFKNTLAIAAPMPRVPPVMITVLLVKSRFICFLSICFETSVPKYDS